MTEILIDKMIGLIEVRTETDFRDRNDDEKKIKCDRNSNKSRVR